MPHWLIYVVVSCGFFAVCTVLFFYFAGKGNKQWDRNAEMIRNNDIVWPDGYGKNESLPKEANACLVAAAPDLLECVRKCVRNGIKVFGSVADYREVIEGSRNGMGAERQAREISALEKATGKTLEQLEKEGFFNE